MEGTAKEIYRYAAENNLITNVSAWFDYHEARNQTSQTYKKEVADKIYGIVPPFAKDAKKLLEKLEQKND